MHLYAIKCPHVTVRRLAQPRCVREHGIENRLQNQRENYQTTFSTSDVAVCCSNASVRSAVRWLRSSVRWRSSLSRRVFSMAMTAWAAKFLH